MPLRKDIHKVMVLGSGPIVIGQAAEFDYAGTQACRALREEGLEVVLVNSNPATIMTDKAMADKVYIEPMTVEAVQEIIKKEHPDLSLIHILIKSFCISTTIRIFINYGSPLCSCCLLYTSRCV